MLELTCQLVVSIFPTAHAVDEDDDAAAACRAAAERAAAAALRPRETRRGSAASVKRVSVCEASAAVRKKDETRPLVIIGFGQNGRLKQAPGGLRPKFDFGMRTHLLIKVPRGSGTSRSEIAGSDRTRARPHRGPLPHARFFIFRSVTRGYCFQKFYFK